MMLDLLSGGISRKSSASRSLATPRRCILVGFWFRERVYVPLLLYRPSRDSFVCRLGLRNRNQSSWGGNDG